MSAWSESTFANIDCENEDDHEWEVTKDGVRYCIWCQTKARRVGRNNKMRRPERNREK